MDDTIPNTFTDIALPNAVSVESVPLHIESGMSTHQKFVPGIVLIMGLLVTLLFFGIVGFVYRKTQNLLLVKDQPYGESIEIQHAVISKGGFIVIKQIRKSGENIIGQSEYLPPDRYVHVGVKTLFSSGVMVGPTVPPATGDILNVYLYDDKDGDRKFTHLDTVSLDVFGKEIKTTFRILPPWVKTTK